MFVPCQAWLGSRLGIWGRLHGCTHTAQPAPCLPQHTGKRLRMWRRKGVGVKAHASGSVHHCHATAMQEQNFFPPASFTHMSKRKTVHLLHIMIDREMWESMLVCPQNRMSCCLRREETVGQEMFGIDMAERRDCSPY